MPHRAVLVVFEDNDAVIKIISKGRSPQLRHLRRTQRVNIDWLYNAFKDPSTRLRYCPTKLQLADILTKGTFNKQQWADLLNLICIGPRRSDLSSTSSASTHTVPSSSNDKKSNTVPAPVTVCAHSTTTTTCRSLMVFKRLPPEDFCSSSSVAIMPPPQTASSAAARAPERGQPAPSITAIRNQRIGAWFGNMKFWLAFLYQVYGMTAAAQTLQLQGDSPEKMASDFSSMMLFSNAERWTTLLKAMATRFIPEDFPAALSEHDMHANSKSAVLYVSDSIGSLKSKNSKTNTAATQWTWVVKRVLVSPSSSTC